MDFCHESPEELNFQNPNKCISNTGLNNKKMGPLGGNKELYAGIYMGFPGVSVGRESACNRRCGFDPWVGNIP